MVFKTMNPEKVAMPSATSTSKRAEAATGAGMRRTLYFTGRREIKLLEEPMPKPGKGEVLVRTLASAISPGTERLIYRGDIPRDIPVDETIASLQNDGGFDYPFKYGYASAGVVEELGAGVEKRWLGKEVFALHPHTSHFTERVENLHMLRFTASVEDALFFPIMETAISLVHDAAPLLGEKVAVFGLGPVGLLTAYLLAKHPLQHIVGIDTSTSRIRRAEEIVGLIP
ncbi:hypothetical protein GF324_12645, partial [bacterium]|nr:hypothetical protein [bacterium]